MPQAMPTKPRVVERVVASLSDFTVSRAAVIPGLMRMTSDSSATARELAGALTHDPALAATVLRVANSAYYGRLRSVGTLDEAITILGFTLIRSLAVAASLNSMLGNCADSEVMNLVVIEAQQEYWPGMPLPTEYWSRPIDGQLRE